MKILIILSLIFVNVTFASAHDVPIAVFHIKESNSVLEIDITFDIEDLSNSIGINISEITLEDMQYYLSQNTNFQFNSQVAILQLSDISIDRGHLEVKGNFGKIGSKINSIKIENTCLTNILNHSNLIQIDLNDEFKDYNMNAKRTIINIDY